MGRGSQEAGPPSRVGPCPEGVEGDRGLGPSLALPTTADEVADVLRSADEQGLPVYPVGGPPYPNRPGVVLDLSRLDQIVELSPDDTLAVVGAGLPVARLAEEIAAVGLDYPPALTTPDGATVGGALARGGIRSPGWGPDRELALGLRIALADGRLVDVGSRAIKNQTGYNLTQLVVGARGALGVIVQATIRLWPRLTARQTLLAEFSDVPTAVRSAVGLATLPIPPTAAELLDAVALEVSAMPSMPRRGAALLILVAGADPSEVGARATALSARLASAGGNARCLDESEADAAWAARRGLPDALASRWPDHVTLEVGIPLDRVEAFVSTAMRTAQESGARLSIYGSAGLGALTISIVDTVSSLSPHPSSLPLREGTQTRSPFPLREGGQGVRSVPRSQSAESVAESADSSLARALVATARSIGGQPLDAAGLDLEYDDWLGLVLPPSSAAALRRVRSALDPRGTLRPART